MSRPAHIGWFWVVLGAACTIDTPASVPGGHRWSGSSQAAGNSVMTATVTAEPTRQEPGLCSIQGKHSTTRADHARRV
jgi:hypothetical protein